MREEQIYTSSNYGEFVFKKENRLVSQKDAEKIAENMKENGWVGAPIEVSETADKRFQIEDGQHRFTAARMANLPIRFIVVRERSAYEQAEHNNMVLKWKPMDYIEMYARNGIPSYKRLLNLCNQFPQFKLGEIQVACGISNSKHIKLIKQGRIQISDERFLKARNILLDLAEIKNALLDVGIFSGTYTKALIALLKVDAIDKERMIQKIERYYDVMDSASTVDKAVDYLERVYNRNAKKDVVYLVDKYKSAKRAMNME